MAKPPVERSDDDVVTRQDLDMFSIDHLGFNPRSDDDPPKLALEWAHEKRIQEIEREQLRLKRRSSLGTLVSAIAGALATAAISGMNWGGLWHGLLTLWR
jgi:hypothetical protein